MRVAITGAGVAGLISALFLARDGHDVIILERDATPLPSGPDEAFTWDRRGAPQVRHPHAFLARLRNLLRDELPDVFADLLAAGATDVGWQEMAPDTLDDRSPRPGDEDLALLACRRTTFEWALRCAALRTERVQLRDGVRATGLVTAPHALAPLVTGLRTSAGIVDADLVVDAGGRHSSLRSLLADIGVPVPEEKHDTDMIYLSRFYRLRPGATEPDKAPFNGGNLGYLGYGVFRGDSRTFSVTLAVGTDDPEMRALLDRSRFDDAAPLLPAAAPWVDQAVSEPIAEVHVMAGLINRERQLVFDGRPSVLGLLAVGDALICTNPLYGRGCSLGGVGAGLLAGALRDHPSNREALALQYHESVEREIAPWYRASVAQDDATRQARLGGVAGDAPAGGLTPSILMDGLLPLSRIDAEVGRALFRTMNLLDAPDALLSNQELMKRVLAYWQARDTRPPEPPAGPTREEFVAALSAAAETASAHA
jgi:2-polyprenyl-6-methoxyphenol hydroxylase-like FAD-dependent oxidoreductase